MRLFVVSSLIQQTMGIKLNRQRGRYGWEVPVLEWDVGLSRIPLMSAKHGFKQHLQGHIGIFLIVQRDCIWKQDLEYL